MQHNNHDCDISYSQSWGLGREIWGAILESCLPQTQKEIENLNRPISTQEIKFAIKKSAHKENSRPR